MTEGVLLKKDNMRRKTLGLTQPLNPKNLHTTQGGEKAGGGGRSQRKPVSCSVFQTYEAAAQSQDVSEKRSKDTCREVQGFLQSRGAADIWPKPKCQT